MNAFEVRLQYPDIQDAFVMLLIGVLFWLFLGLYFWRQRKRTKYRDDVEIDADRKVRMHLIEGIELIIVCLIVSIFCSVLIEGYAGVVYRARLAAGYYG